jgi:AraC-like DNA-binding protein
MSITPAPPRVESVSFGRDPAAFGGPCLILVTHAELLVSSDDDTLTRMGEGDLLTVSPGARCSARAARGDARARVFRVGAGWVEHALDVAGCDAVEREASCFVDRCCSDPARRAQHLFDELASTPTAADRGQRLRDSARRLELLALALASHPAGLETTAARRPSACRATLSRVVAALRDAPLEHASLAGLARQIGLSERQISRIFREEFGTTFRDHLATLRLDRAKQLLAATDLPVIEVAGHTGWSSLAHFNAVFRRRVGVTPSAFRAGGFAIGEPIRAQ